MSIRRVKDHFICKYFMLIVLQNTLQKFCSVHKSVYFKVVYGEKHMHLEKPAYMKYNCKVLFIERLFIGLSSYFQLFFLYLVTIESSGALPPEILFTEAVKILEDKCERVITELS